MNVEKFWSMIEEARPHDERNRSSPHEALIAALIKLPEQEIIEFDRILWAMKFRAYRADVWDAAGFVACGCGDDGFTDFHDWLITHGQAVYEKVLEDPENLADIVPKEQRFDIFDGYMSDSARDAYERKTGKEEIPDSGYPERPVLHEPLTPEDELPAKFPRIWAKFGGCDDEELFW